MVDQRARPGVEHADHAQSTAYEARVLRQLLRSGGRGAEEQTIDQLLVAARDLAQFFRQGEGEQKVGDRQEQRLLLLQPLLPGRVLALGTVAILARMVAVALLAALGTLVDLSAQGFGATSLDVSHRVQVAGRHARPVLLPVLGTVAAKDLGQLYHVSPAISRSTAIMAISSPWRVRWV